MKKYTIEDLKNLTDDKLFEITKAIVENKVQFLDEELQIIYDKMSIFTKVHKDINEYCKMSKLAGHIVLPEEYEALKDAYVAEANEEWPTCKSALEVFFEWMGEVEDILHYDLSLWDYQHLLRWFDMLTMTGLCDAPEGTVAGVFAWMVNEQVINRMPKHMKPKLWEGVQKIFPEIAGLFDTSKTVTEDGTKCVDLSAVAEKLEMSEDEIIMVFEGKEPGKYLVTKDRTYEIQ